MTKTSKPTHRIVSPLLTTALVLAAAGTALASDWELDPSHTTAQFSVRHMMVSTVRGQFGKVTGTVNLDDKDLTHSKLQVTIDASTIDTHEPKRDAHLKSPDFFDVAKFPNITFASTKVEKGAKGKFKVTGDLTMHGVTKPVVLAVDPLSAAVKNPWGKTVRGTSATATINRKDWGLGWNKALEAGGVLVGDEVQIQIDAELSEKAAEHAKL
jgi:polyisoprenoid-binding protein YceI